jgi:hypothetical protein
MRRISVLALGKIHTINTFVSSASKLLLCQRQRVSSENGAEELEETEALSKVDLV